MPEPDPPAAIPTPSGATPASIGAPGEAPPFPVPDHTLIRRVGRGAYGEVWLAHNTLGTWRAVKFIRRSSFDDDRPFERELAGIQRFEPISRTHESQLNILHVGRAEDGFYYIMELADDMSGAFASGGTSAASLQSLSPELESGPRGTRPSEKRPAETLNPDTYTPRNLRTELHLRGRLPATECLRIGLALTTALEHLHKHGLVHRDIKPSNIVFVNGIPKLADIGLVARAEATISFVGTEGFIPPEGPGTRQADIYSLGKVLYELSTGHDRHQFPELPTNIVTLPDRAELSELNEVLLKACHRDPKERYQTAAEMHADLALLESGRSVVRLRGLERRLRFVQRAGAAVTVIAALAAALYLWQARQTGIVRNLATEKSQLAEEKTKLADQNREQLVRLRIANGVRLMDEDDLSGALLWFAEALPLVTNKPAEEAIHRIRIQQVLDQMPHLLEVESEGENVRASGFSPDGKSAVIATYKGQVRVLDIESRRTICQPPKLPGVISQIRFTRDGRRLLLSSSPLQGNVRITPQFIRPAQVAVLDAQSGNEIFPAAQVIPGMSSNLFYSAFSPDDRWLAASFSNNVIRVLDANDGHLVAELKGHTDEIQMLTFSADSSLLASASKDKTARLWRLPSGEPVGLPLQHDASVLRVAFSPNGSRLATATISPYADVGNSSDTNCVVQNWDVQTGRSVGPPIQETKLVFMLTFDEHSGKTLITGDYPGPVRVLDAETHEEKFSPLITGGGGGDARCWAFSRDGRLLAIGNGKGTARVWSMESGEPLTQFIRHAGWVESVHFSPDGSRLLTTSDDGTVRFWNLAHATKTLTLRFDADVNEDFGIHESWGRNPGPLVVGLKDGSIRLVDSESLNEVHRLNPAHTNALPYTFFAGPQGHSWAGYSRRTYPNLEIWQAESNLLKHITLPIPNQICPPIFSPDETRFLTCSSSDRKIRIWKTSDGILEQAISLPEGRAFVYEFLPDAKRALVVRGDEQLELMDIASQQTLQIFPHPGFDVSRVAYDEQVTRFAAVGGQFGIVFDLATGKPLTPPFKHVGDLLTLDFSSDGRRLFTAGVDVWVKAWDTSAGELLLQPMNMKDSIRFVCRSADDRFVTASDHGNNARVWDATTAEPVTPFVRHKGRILPAAVTRNHRLVTLSSPNLLQAWDLVETRLRADVIADYAKLLASRRLSAGGTLLPLKAEEMAELYRSLRTRAPELFE